jgi:hypothetical protein
VTGTGGFQWFERTSAVTVAFSAYLPFVLYSDCHLGDEWEHDDNATTTIVKKITIIFTKPALK